MTLSNAQKRRRATERARSAADRVAAVATPCEPKCIECGQIATKLVGWTAVYRPRPERPDLMKKQFWLCDCGAYIGCHAGTTIPLGFPAGPATQRARMDAHAAFDRLWKLKAEREGCRKHEARGAGYRWLAEQLGIEPALCHIGMMDAAMAGRVAVLCRPGSRPPVRSEATITATDQASGMNQDGLTP